MAKIADGVLHTFTTGEKIDADQAPSGGALNPIFEIIREAVNNTDGRVDELVQALVGVDANRGVFQTKVEVFTATEGQTAFTLTKGTYTVGGDRLQVYVGAAIQTVEGGNFTETSSTVFTLSEGVPAGTSVIAVWVEGLLISAEVAIHGSRHESGGADELDILKLKNGNQIGILSNSIATNTANITANTNNIVTKAERAYVDSRISTINAGPKGTYATLTDLQTAFPTGNTNIYIVTADGKWYYWNSSAWTAGGIYQSTGISDNSVTLDQLQISDYLLNSTENEVENNFPCEVKGNYKIMMDAKSDVYVSNGNLADKLNMVTDSTNFNSLAISSTPEGFSVSGTASANTYIKLDSILNGQVTNSGLGTKNYSIPVNGDYKICIYTTQNSVASGSPSINIRKSDNSGNVIQLLFTNGTTQLTSTAFTYTDSTSGAFYVFVPAGCVINYAAKVALIPSINKNYGTYAVPSTVKLNVKNYIGNTVDSFLLSSATGKAYSLTGLNADKIKVVKAGNNLSIYVPCKTSNNFIKYNYTRFDDAFHNFYQWRVNQTYVTDMNYDTIYAFDDDTEWEGAIWELGAADFIGGYHGDEINQTLSILIDSIPVNIGVSDFTVYAKNEVRIVNTSILNRCNTPNDNVFTRYRVNIWTKESYTVENKYIALQNFHIKQSKIALMSCKYSYVDSNAITKELVTNARTNHDYAITNMISPFTNSGVGVKYNDTTRIELWGNTSGLYTRIDCVYDSKYPNRNQYVEDFRSENRCKAYFDVTGDYSMVTGESLTSKSTIFINA